MQPFKVFVPGRKVTMVVDGHREQRAFYHGEHEIDERALVILLLREPGTILFNPLDAVECGAVSKEELVALGYDVLEAPDGGLVLDKPDITPEVKADKNLKQVKADADVNVDPYKDMPRFSQMEDEELKDECVSLKIIVKRTWKNDDIVGALKKAWRKAQDKKASK